ncbi:MAG: DUF3826 domain-containing protein [Bacteroidales bacterium]|nr:DUF3826 domain-containing protein [Bacteroidales bacterium]
MALLNKQLICSVIAVASFWATAIPAYAQVKLNDSGRDSAYVQVILQRSEKNISALNLEGDTKQNVLHIVANRYFELNDIYAERDSTHNKELCDSRLYRSHFAFPAQLGMYLNEQQIEQVKDGITMGVVQVTYKAHIDMIPSLKEEEKQQIMLWLKEARELALDAESSKKKHEVFGKYKGRINNYLTKRGYDLKQEREAWYKRMEAEGKKF